MRKQVQEFATSLLDHARTSAELDTILNHDPDGVRQIGDTNKLERLQLAIEFKQKGVNNSSQINKYILYVIIVF